MPPPRDRAAGALPVDVCLAVGVDRFDYTKGILERLNAVERLLEKWPSWIGRFVFVQVAAPTRSALDEYRSFQERVQRTSSASTSASAGPVTSRCTCWRSTTSTTP
jgi:trehalose-6-phosphate synthase